MRKIILLASTALLAGCVSPESVQQRQPLFVAETTKSAADYFNCVHEHWAEHAPYSQKFSRPNGSYRVRHYGGNIVDVTPTATGAHVEMREPPPHFNAPEEEAQACL
ncbi:hypothetical protein [Paraburkholderia atlantica]|uniref:hypothetical protein n=1 Tax=Paraburkholderia atlantica TaxID=2654982 RepID=UPI0012FF49B4|nr:hypothetical protein [Paraburkholderia atlantica]MBB5510973.1 hypothetical protein [Paraburkholderia atlantica]